MALSSGIRLGPYEIAAQIGVGGKGEMYRALDTKLTIRRMRHLGSSLLVLVLLVSPATAQDADRVELKGVLGMAGFLDEATDYRAVVGGAARFYISPGFALEPEFLYLRESPQREDYSFQTGAIWQFQSDARFQPYLVVGAGVRHSRFRFPGALQEQFSSNAFIGDGGVGARILVGSRFTISPEFRLGVEPIMRAIVGFGYAFH